MLRFISRRVTFIILVCFFIVFFTQLGMRMIRNSEAPRPDYGLVSNAKPAWRDTREYIRDAVGGNFGLIPTSYGLVQVRTILAEVYVNSMGLLLAALVGATLVGLYIGAMTALTKRRELILPLLTLTILGISTPSFFAGLLLRQGELLYLRFFGRPLVSMAGFGWDYQHMLMPVLVLAARPLAYITRASFLAITRVMEEDYIRTAYAKGLSKRRTVNVHALRNLAVPVMTAIGVSLRFSLSSLPIVEFLFVWPGMGLKLLEAIDMRHTSLVITLAAAMGLTFLMVNLLLDIAYRIVDPRTRDI